MSRLCWYLQRSLFVAAILGCANVGEPSAELRGLAGTVELVPNQRARSPSASRSYGSRKYREVVPVDYTTPGFVVVYLDGGKPPQDIAEFEIRDSPVGVMLRPRHGVAGFGGEILVKNASAADRVVSCPEVPILESVAPGATLRFRPRNPGRLSLVLPGARLGSSAVFVSPGPFAQVDRQGRWSLADAPAGDWTLKTWHPRFPEFSRRVKVVEGRATFLNLEIGTRAAVELHR